MIIRKVRMVNFRGFREKEMDFQAMPVVLLTAANGIGKTTTIDAIEWCLTGEIGRLKTAFGTRSSNETNRKMNSAGILKHRDAGPKAKVRVELTLFDGEQEIVLCRVQTKDELNPKHSEVTIDKSAKNAEFFLQEYIGDSFYNFHFCDIQKSFHVQSKRREDLKEFFAEFITNYDAQLQIAANLDLFAEDVARYGEDAGKKKHSQDKIVGIDAQIAQARATAKPVSYPQSPFYPGERLDVAALDRKELTAQRDTLHKCGYRVAGNALEALVKNEERKGRLSVLREVVSHWETKGDAIRLALETGLPGNTQAITARAQTLDKLKKLSFEHDSIISTGTALIALGLPGFSQAEFEADSKSITEKEARVKELAAGIDLLTKNNKMLKLLSYLSVRKKQVTEYRDAAVAKNGTVRCPVCGSETFGDMEKDAILQEADAYIRRNGEAVKAKEAEQATLRAQIDELYGKLILRARDAVEKETARLTAEIAALKALAEEVRPYFDAVKKLQLDPAELTAEAAVQLLAGVESELLDGTGAQLAQETYRQVLTVLNYKLGHETIRTTLAKVTPLAAGSPEVTNFSYDMFVSKLNAIESLLADQALLDLQQKREQYIRENEDLDRELDRLRELHDKAAGRAEDIRRTVEQLSKDEFEKVGPALSKFYNKLSRINADGGIRIVPEKEGISLVDGKGKNIVNVLSNGQISVFMLAYFFAGINMRNDREKMKVYFIDDLTACMDDVNMLAFLDLLKYQLHAKATMEQLFFVTCDERISKLLQYKLTGHGIGLCWLEEKDFA